MVRILIVEDDLNRITQFKQNFKNANLTIVSNYYQAYYELTTKNIFDYIFLDHDLGINNGSGFDVAKLMYDYPLLTPKFIYIHSANPVGAKNMKNYLPQARLAPMIWKKEIIF